MLEILSLHNVVEECADDQNSGLIFLKSENFHTINNWQLKVSFAIPDVYWPGKICQFSTSIFCQMISHTTSVRTPSSLEMGESVS